MADLIESPVWDAGVYQIETTDPVLGGAPNPATGAGMTNIPHQQLARRTAWLKAEVEALQADLAALNVELDALAAADRPVIAPVFIATTADIVLSGLQTIDGVTLTAGRRVLVKNQTVTTENGIYIAASGAWSRAADLAAGSVAVPGALVAITAGTSQGDTLWTISSPNQGAAPVVGTTGLIFSVVTAAMAPLASPNLTGLPTAPTAALDTSTTQIATTAFVLGHASNAAPLMSGAADPGTGTRWARNDHRHPVDTSRAPIASPVFTGTPAAPNPATDTANTQIATTAFVIGQASNGNPLMDGAASPGTGTRWARNDHRHPTDTSRAPVDSPAFTGSPTAPLAAQFDNSNLLATTAFVKRALGNHADAQTFTGNFTLTAADAGDCWVFGEAIAATVTLPSIAATEVGSVFEFINTGTANLTIQRAGTDQIDLGPTTATSIVVPPNHSLRIVRSGGSSLWHPVGITAQALQSTLQSSIGANGWQRLPSGLILQWGTIAVALNSTANGTFPLTFPNAALHISGSGNVNNIATDEQRGMTFPTLNASGFTVANDSPANTVRWFAIGN